MDDSTLIMIVEDSDTQALQLQLFLEERGWEVVRASNGAEALDLLNTVSPHLLILDYYLPGMDGDELCRQIRINMQTRDLPILMLTAEGRENTEQYVLESGADDFVAKQTDHEILGLRIQSLLRKKRIERSIVGRAEAYFRKARLLIVDDSPTYREFLAGELGHEGYAVQMAEGGREALSRIQSDVFDCVLLDLMMPGMDGIETCTHITELRATMDNPIVVLMLTAQESKADMTRGLAAGADDFVGKSNDMVVLKARIRALLRRKFYQEETQRIVEELKNKEMETLKAKADKEAAEAKAALTTELEETTERLRQEILEREHAQSELRQAHDLLEKRVQERTQELSETNERLVQEVQERKLAEHKLEKEAQKLARANRELERLLWITTHHLQEPLRKIQSICDLLIKQFAKEPSQDQAVKNFDRLLETARKAQLLVNDLVTFSQISFVKDVERRTIDLSSLVREVIGALHDKIQQADAHIHVEDLPVIQGITPQLHCLFSHLITNALKFRKSGIAPKIAIASPHKHQVVITDNGIGFEEQHQEKIFNLFEKLHTDRNVEGTGMGLALCRKIAENHNGSLKAVGVPGQGSTFLISFSLDEEAWNEQ